MKDFFIYFFGQGESEEFAIFTLAHFLPIAVMLGVTFLIYRFRNEIRESKHEGKLRMALAFAMIISEMSYYWRLVGTPGLNPNAAERNNSMRMGNRFWQLYGPLKIADAF